MTQTPSSKQHKLVLKKARIIYGDSPKKVSLQTKLKKAKKKVEDLTVVNKVLNKELQSKAWQEDKAIANFPTIQMGKWERFKKSLISIWGPKK